MPGPPGAASGLDAARSDRPPSPDAPCESAASGRPVDAPRRGADRRVHMQHKLSLAKRQAEEKPTAAPYGAHTLSQLEDEVLAGHPQSAILECRAVRDSVSALRLSARRLVTDCTKAILQRRFGQRRGGPYGPAVQDEKGPLVSSLFLAVGASLNAPLCQEKIVDEEPAVVL